MSRVGQRMDIQTRTSQFDAETRHIADNLDTGICLYLIDRLQSSTIAATITLLIVSVTLILILAPCNNSAIHCSNEELQDMKIAVRKRLVLYCLIVPPLLLLKPLYSTVWIVAAAADAFLLVLAKIGVGIK